MPSHIADLPFDWLEFNKKGNLTSAPPTLSSETTDVIVISHGWKTDRAGALEFYQPLISNVAAAWSQTTPSAPVGRKYAVLGVLWPSKQFDANYENPTDAATNAMAAAAPGATQDLDDASLRAEIEAFAAFVGADPALIARQTDDAVRTGLRQSSCATLMTTLAAAIAPSTGDAELKADGRDYSAAEAQRVLQSLSPPPTFPVSPDVGQAQGLGSAIRGLFEGPKAAIGRLLNQLTFYEMKARAGVVGAKLAEHVLPILAPVPRIHLVGHSFGARLVTACAHAAPQGAKLQSLSLLQGAFSHNALSTSKGGAFAGAHEKILGPTLITHTHRDKAVTLAYAVASRLSRDSTKAIGDKKDKFGAIGANGALELGDGALAEPQVSDTATPLTLQPRKVHNMQCDTFISGHMDVSNPNVGRVVAHCVSA